MSATHQFWARQMPRLPSSSSPISSVPPAANSIWSSGTCCRNIPKSLVFKHYPLTEIHPWAMTAAEASQCVYQQGPTAFWNFHDAVYDAQDTITPENAWD